MILALDWSPYQKTDIILLLKNFFSYLSREIQTVLNRTKHSYDKNRFNEYNLQYIVISLQDEFHFALRYVVDFVNRLDVMDHNLWYLSYVHVRRYICYSLRRIGPCNNNLMF